jgi:hypothetical protein
MIRRRQSCSGWLRETDQIINCSHFCSSARINCANNMPISEPIRLAYIDISNMIVVSLVRRVDGYSIDNWAERSRR